MKFSTKDRYALRLMTELAAMAPGALLPLKAVSDSQEISQKYLEQIGSVVNYVNQTFGLFKRAEALRPAKLLTPKVRE